MAYDHYKHVLAFHKCTHKTFWQPNTTVSNSCSIGAYDGDTYAIALSSCVNTSPNPDLQASAHTLTGFVTS